MIFRDEATKRDPVKNWNRPERSFFAAGACHILAHVFLEKYGESNFLSVLIKPKRGFRGSHLFVTDGRWVFDWHGYSEREKYLKHYFLKLERFFPGWSAEMIEIQGDLTLEDFCNKYCHRKPDQYLHDPIVRAQAYLMRFPDPKKLQNCSRDRSSCSAPNFDLQQNNDPTTTNRKPRSSRSAF
jgi:hypothetical protein